MKVRHKATGIEIEVRKPIKEVSFYSTLGGSMIHVDDPQWELVKEEEWDDVTAHIEVGRYESHCRASGHLYACDRSNSGINAFFDQGYRLRKIDGMHNGPAFIVEKRKES